MSEPVLTTSAKKAMRTYILSFFVLPGGSLAAIIVLLLGILWNDIVKQDADNKAFQAASNNIFSLTQEAFKATENAIEAKERLDGLVADVKKALGETEKLGEQLKTVQVLKETDELVRKVSENLMNRDDFREKLTGDLALKDQILKSGTVMPADWKRFRSGGTYGIESNVLIDLSEISQAKIFLSRRGESHIWETQGLSAYPLVEQANTENKWDKGFRVLIHSGALDHRKDAGNMLRHARSYRWHVDWLVVGQRRGNPDK